MTNSESPVYRRMAFVSSAIAKDFDSAIAGKVAKEAEAVAAGKWRRKTHLPLGFRTMLGTGLPIDQSKRDLATVEWVLLGLPEEDQLPFLAYAEQQAKARGDLSALRALRQSRKDRERLSMPLLSAD